jgi:hypothetical protein
MLSHRIIPAGAVLLAVTIGSAAAQEQTREQTSAGKPLQLLQFARHQAKAPLHHHAGTVEKLAKHAEVKRHIAKRTEAKHRKMFAAVHSHAVHPPHRVAEAAPPPAPEAAQPRPAAAPASIWPAVDAATPGSIAVPAPPAAPQNVKTEPVLNDAPNAIATDGNVAQAAPPPEQNGPPIAVDPHPAAAEPAPGNSAAAEPAVRAMMVRPAAADSDAKSPVGSASWLLQVLAALGGTLTAGVVAWFLILRSRSEPQEEEFFAETLAPGE